MTPRFLKKNHYWKIHVMFARIKYAHKSLLLRVSLFLVSTQKVQVYNFRNGQNSFKFLFITSNALPVWLKFNSNKDEQRKSQIFVAVIKNRIKIRVNNVKLQIQKDNVLLFRDWICFCDFFICKEFCLLFVVPRFSFTLFLLFSSLQGSKY